MSKKWRWYVYIIECLDNTYYTGLSWNPSNRAEQHISRRGSKYTSRHGFKKVVYLEEHEDFEVARKREVQIKDWSQEKKRKLISGKWKKIGIFILRVRNETTNREVLWGSRLTSFARTIILFKKPKGGEDLVKSFFRFRNCIG